VRTDVARDLAKSSDAFGHLVCGGEYVPVESVEGRDLDALAGIDGWQVRRDLGRMRGLACRVQWTERPFDTFTIRLARSSGAETEYAKRLDAIQSPDGWLYPALTVQAYVSPSQRMLLSAAAVPTRDLYEVSGPRLIRRNGTDGNAFVVVPWTELKRAVVWRDLF
jgi:hypothetical protein